jgi:hypothetical protein
VCAEYGELRPHLSSCRARRRAHTTAADAERPPSFTWGREQRVVDVLVALRQDNRADGRSLRDELRVATSCISGSSILQAISTKVFATRYLVGPQATGSPPHFVHVNLAAIESAMTKSALSIPALAAATLCVTMSILAHGAGANLTIHNAETGDQLCMDASQDRPEQNGTPVYLYKCHGRENQRWTVTHDANGQSAIVGMGGYCLDVRGSHSRADGTPVELHSCEFGSQQRFNVLAGGQIREPESGKCLAALKPAERSPIVLDSCVNSPAEFWHFKR